MAEINFTFDIRHGGEVIADFEGVADVTATPDGYEIDGRRAYNYRIEDIRAYTIGSGKQRLTVSLIGSELGDDVERFLWAEQWSQGIFEPAVWEAEEAA